VIGMLIVDDAVAARFPDYAAVVLDLRRSLLTLTPGATLELERIGPGWPAASGG
jgi:hypothetical protein